MSDDDRQTGELPEVTEEIRQHRAALGSDLDALEEMFDEAGLDGEAPARVQNMMAQMRGVVRRIEEEYGEGAIPEERERVDRLAERAGL